MGVYKGFVDGYKLEAVYGTSIITLAADTTYLWGAIAQKVVHPSPATSVIYGGTAVSAQEVAAGELWKGKEVLTGRYVFGMQNAIPLWAIMGKSATTGPVGSVYTHTITTPTAVAGVLPLLPSFTIQHEMAGTATNWQVQFLGCKMASFNLECIYEDKILMGIVDWIAKNAVKGTFELDDAPVLPPTANAAPYHFVNMTRTWDHGGTPEALDGLKGILLTIDPDITPEYVGRERNLKSVLEGTRKLYTLKMTYSQGSSKIWEELIATGNVKELYFKFTRDTDDYIEITLTDCQITGHELITPELGMPLIEEVTLEPRSVSISVKDEIAGSYYGE